ncbi:prepilin peptidase [Eubacterium ventriosum]
MLAIKIIAGALIGAILKIPCDFIEEKLLSKRNIVFNQMKRERIILHLIMAAAGAVIMWKQSFAFIEVYCFLILMICEMIAVIDLHHRIIPNDLLLSILIVKIAFSVPTILGVKGFPEFSILYSMIGLIAGFVIFVLPAAFAKNVGAGDIKLAACAGFCLGIMNLLYAIVLMGICVLAYATIKSRMAYLTVMHEMIPMGPFIAVAMVIVMNFC